MKASNLTAKNRLLLNGEWEFAVAPEGNPPQEGWQQVRVPHRSREFEDAPPIEGWYRTTLSIPDNWQTPQHNVVLDLGRVRHYGRAYLNDQFIGEHYNMRLPWCLDLSNQVQAGEVYDLAVYTHNCTGDYAHPHAKELSEAVEEALDTRFWRTSAPTIGMEGDVWLSLEPQIYIDDPYVVTSVRDQTITVEATVRNHSQAAFAGQLTWHVTHNGQTELQLPASQVEVGTGQSQTLRVSAPWPNATLWGRPPYGEPVLYFLRGRLDGAGQTTDETAVRFGFRELWADGDRLLLNGETLMPWGDHTTPYVYERQWLTRKFTDLTAANISIVEHHRYDPPPVYYDVADELGVFVVGANFCVGTAQVPPELDEREFQLVMDNHLAVADVWLRRARNHPSILFWDITDAREPHFCVPLLRKVKELDQTRIAEVTFDVDLADADLIELVDCYRLFSGLDNIEAAIEKIRTDPRYPRKPLRVGEAGIFTQGAWGAEEEPPLQDGWWDFLMRIAERNIHGLQTFYFADMDYHGFTNSVPGMLAAPLDINVSWPSHSGPDARIDPFGEGTQAARGKQHLSLNWCDPSVPVSQPTATYTWSQEVFRRMAGRNVGPLAQERVPEVIVRVERGGAPVGGAQVFVEPLQDQGTAPFGVRADAQGTSWFILAEPGEYRFTCAGVSVEVEAHCAPVAAPAGYDHIQYVQLALSGK